MAVPHFQFAGHPARRAERQGFAHPVVIGEEEDEFDIAGLVLDQHLERRFRARVGGRAMLGDAHFQRDDGADLGLPNPGPRAAVERGVGQVEQDIDNARAVRAIEQPVEQLGDLWPDPGEAGGGSEKRIEQGGAHGASVARQRWIGRGGPKATGIDE